jgi:ribosomal protein S18 acetylase RimI-like enzyme
MTVVTEVESLGTADVPAAADVLARAFYENPVFMQVFAEDAPAKRLRHVQGCMLGFVKATQRDGVGEIVKVDSKVAAVSLAFAPGKFPPGVIAQLIGARGPLACGPRRALRLARVDQEMRKSHLREPHWYLWFLGTAPDQQGKGLGSRLLRSLSAKSLASQVPCYLETEKASSVRLYEKHGYVVTGEDVLRSIGVKLWFMRRP